MYPTQKESIERYKKITKMIEFLYKEENKLLKEIKKLEQEKNVLNELANLRGLVK